MNTKIKEFPTEILIEELRRRAIHKAGQEATANIFVRFTTMIIPITEDLQRIDELQCVTSTGHFFTYLITDLN